MNIFGELLIEIYIFNIKYFYSSLYRSIYIYFLGVYINK